MNKCYNWNYKYKKIHLLKSKIEIFFQRDCNILHFENS